MCPLNCITYALSLFTFQYSKNTLRYLFFVNRLALDASDLLALINLCLFSALLNTENVFFAMWYFPIEIRQTSGSHRLGFDLFRAGARCSSVVRAFAHGAMGRRIDHSWSGPIELFLVQASATQLVCAILSVGWCI